MLIVSERWVATATYLQPRAAGQSAAGTVGFPDLRELLTGKPVPGEIEETCYSCWPAEKQIGGFNQMAAAVASHTCTISRLFSKHK